MPDIVLSAAILLAAALTPVILAGCGGSSHTIDNVNLEKAIEVSIAQQRHQLTVVACPKGVRARAGVTFTCTATMGSGQQVPIAVTGKDSVGNVHYQGFPASTATAPTTTTTTTTTTKKKSSAR